MTSSVQISRPNRALIIPGQNDPSLYHPKGTLPDGRVVVPHDIRNTLLLRNVGYDVPNPMGLYYDWPGGPPYAVQRTSAEMLVENPRAYLLNRQGTGKTKTALWAWDFLNRIGHVRKLLVVGKLSTLDFVWGREAGRTLPEKHCVVLGSDKGMSKVQRLKLLAEEADIYVINHDGLKVIADEILAREDIDCLVLDELAVYRNNSDRSKHMRHFSKRFRVCWGLTGAPMPNVVTDVWAQCQIITPHTVPKYFRACRETLMTRVSQYEWRPRPEAKERAFGMMQPSLRYTLDDVMELPPEIHRTVECPLSEDQKKYYDEFRKKLAVMVEEKQITAANAAGVVNKLLQICGGWVYAPAPDVLKLDATPRLNLLRDLIEENDQKVLVFAPYRHTIEGIAEFLNSKQGLGNGSAAVIHGDTKHRERILSDFQDTDKYKVLVAHPGTTGHGLTLTRANCVVWFSPIPDYDIFDQANARIRRIGQQHKQQYFYLRATAVEDRIYGILSRKEKIQTDFLALVEDVSRGLK